MQQNQKQMQLSKIYNLIINNLKTTITMAKSSKLAIDLFEAKPTINFKEIDAEFGRLESHITDSSIEPRAKQEMQKLIDGYQVQTGAKVNHLTNLALLNSAIGWVNKYSESLNK